MWSSDNALLKTWTCDLKAAEQFKQEEIQQDGIQECALLAKSVRNSRA